MSTAGQQAHVLLIDGSVSNLHVMRRVLEHGGYRVSVAPMPLASPCLIDLAPDVIVQELRFQRRPEIGWEAVIRLQQTPALVRVPIILCTTESAWVLEPAMAANLDTMGIRVVLKPFLLENLLSAVADALIARPLLDQNGTTGPAARWH